MEASVSGGPSGAHRTRTAALVHVAAVMSVGFSGDRTRTGLDGFDAPRWR
jgi:hypothetical protein